MPRLRVIVLLGICPWLQAQAPSRDDARRQDLSFISTQLPKLHPNFFFQLNPVDFTNAVNQLSAQIPNLTDAQFDVGLAALVAMAGDAHTLLSLNSSAAQSAGFQTFPLQFRWLDDGMFVIGAATEYSRALGTRLVRVGATPIDAVMDQLATLISHSNLQWVRYVAPSYLRGQQVLQGLGILAVTPTSFLTFQTLAGDQFTLDVAPAIEPILGAPSASQGPLPLYLQNTSQNYWFTYSAPLRMLYFKYNVCEDDPNNPFSAFAAKVLSAFDSNPVDTFVLDFRSNTGGNSSVINPLLNGLAQRLLTLNNPSFHAYDVIDKGTFSSGMDDASLVKSQAIQAAALFPSLSVTVIGEPTGGSPGEYGEVVPFTLPNSKLTGQFSTRFISAPAGIPQGPSFLPDVSVPFRSTDYFARHDPVFAAMIARWEGAPPAPSGNFIVVNGASFRVEDGIAAGSFAAGFGSFSSTVDQVLVNGQAGTVVNASGSQVNFVVPTSVSSGPATITALAAGNQLASGQATITASGPGIFVVQPTDPSQPGAVLNQDSTLNTAANPAAKGSVVQIFATGFPALINPFFESAEILINGLPAQVLFSGLIPQFPGLWQINAVVPDTATGQVPLTVIAGSASNAVTIWVQ